MFNLLIVKFLFFNVSCVSDILCWSAVVWSSAVSPGVKHCALGVGTRAPMCNVILTHNFTRPKQRPRPQRARPRRWASICEAELDWLDMRITPKKSSCNRFGARFGVECSNISTSDDSKLPWSDNWTFNQIKYSFWSSRSFGCSFSHAKHSMYRAFKAVFGKVGRIASPDVVVQFVKS